MIFFSSTTTPKPTTKKSNKIGIKERLKAGAKQSVLKFVTIGKKRQIIIEMIMERIIYESVMEGVFVTISCPVTNKTNRVGFFY